MMTIFPSQNQAVPSSPKYFDIYSSILSSRQAFPVFIYLITSSLILHFLYILYSFIYHWLLVLFDKFIYVKFIFPLCPLFPSFYFFSLLLLFSKHFCYLYSNFPLVLFQNVPNFCVDMNHIRKR